MRSRARGDSLSGTALPTHRFLLIEDYGPWGSRPHPTGSLPEDIAAHVHAAAQRASARVLLIRRPGRRPSTPVRRWALADVDADRIRWGSTESAGALLDVDFLSDGALDDAPVVLVCTQGRHDVCCATEGRPVAAAFAERRPAATWECTHVGGDRFAANVLVLPAGAMYGHVQVVDVDRLLAAADTGLVVPELLRGRCGLAPAAQVAEAQVRAAWGESGVHALAIDAVDHTGHDSWRVVGRHRGDGREFAIELTERHDPTAQGLTCSAVGPGSLRSWTLTSLEA